MKSFRGSYVHINHEYSYNLSRSRCHLAHHIRGGFYLHRGEAQAGPWQVRAGSFSFSLVTEPVGSGPNFRFGLRNVHSFNVPFWYCKFLYKLVSLGADV